MAQSFVAMVAALIFSQCFAVETCPEGMVFNECGSSCPLVCGESEPMMCSEMCVARCSCLEETPIMDQSGNSCYETAEECPVIPRYECEEGSTAGSVCEPAECMDGQWVIMSIDCLAPPQEGCEWCAEPCEDGFHFGYIEGQCCGTCVSDFVCTTKEMWTEEKTNWCCGHEKLGCPDDCDSFWAGRGCGPDPHKTIGCPSGSSAKSREAWAGCCFDASVDCEDSRVCCEALTPECEACKMDVEIDVFCAKCVTEGLNNIACDMCSEAVADCGECSVCLRVSDGKCKTGTARDTEAECLAGGDLWCGGEEPTMCCEALTPECEACKLDVEVDVFCAKCDEEGLNNIACDMCNEEPAMCCKAMTADCLACISSMTPEEYCETNPETVGCWPAEEGAACGSGAFLFYGDCADGLSCECVGACANPDIMDAPSTCVRRDDPCATVRCAFAMCPDGSGAPVPEDGCCGDASLCPLEDVCAPKSKRKCTKTSGCEWGGSKNGCEDQCTGLKTSKCKKRNGCKVVDDKSCTVDECVGLSKNKCKKQDRCGLSYSGLTKSKCKKTDGCDPTKKSCFSI